MKEKKERDEFYYRRERRRQERLHRKRRKRRIVLALTALALLSIIGGAILLISKGIKKPVDLSAIEIPEWIVQDFLPENKYSRPGTLLEEVNSIVVHYVANPGTTAENNRNYFANLANQPEKGGTYASSHFIIGIDGTILQCIPLTELAYTSNDRNSDTVSIEVCHPDETGVFSEESYEALVKLTAWLCQELKVKNNEIIRHYDISGKLCPKYYVANEDLWEEFKNDVKKYPKESFE